MELLIVITVIALLALIAVPELQETRVPAERTSAQGDLVRLQSYVTDLYQESGSYTSSTSGFVSTATGTFAPTAGNTYRITPAADAQGTTLTVQTPTGVSCTMNLGTLTSPGVATCTP